MVPDARVWGRPGVSVSLSDSPKLPWPPNTSSSINGSSAPHRPTRHVPREMVGLTVVGWLTAKGTKVTNLGNHAAPKVQVGFDLSGLLRAGLDGRSPGPTGGPADRPQLLGSGYGGSGCQLGSVGPHPLRAALAVGQGGYPNLGRESQA